jgi:hypothetical protein
MKTFRFLLIASMALAFAGCGAAVNKGDEGSDGDRSIVDDRLAAEAVLVSFFNDLSEGRFEEAAAKFNPEDAEVWEWLGGFYGESSEEGRAADLDNYCSAVGTCLPVTVISSTVVNEGFSFKVNFINQDGSIFVLGPCCGATEEEMPSVQEFDYQVWKFGEDYKVVTPPQYVP